MNSESNASVGPWHHDYDEPLSAQCPVCKRAVVPDPLVLGPVWCQRCIRDERGRG